MGKMGKGEWETQAPVTGVSHRIKGAARESSQSYRNSVYGGGRELHRLVQLLLYN